MTLADGSQYLIHKGNNYGISSQTVVVNARHMSSSWKVTFSESPATKQGQSTTSGTLVSPPQVVATHNFQGTKTVAEFVADGGSNYSLIFANCHMASGNMMRP